MLFRRLWPAIVWALIILILTGTPGNYVPSVRSFWDWLAIDKTVHLITFGILSFLILNGLLQQYLESKKRYLFVLTAIGITLAYGLLTEVMQDYVFINRDGNVFDFIADSIGAVMGWLGFIIVHGKKIKTYSNTNQD